MKWEETPKGKEWTKEYHRQYYLKNKEKYDKRNRGYMKDPVKRERKNQLDRNRTKEAKRIIYQVLGGAACKHCGITDERVLQLDHINGGGFKDRKTNRSVVKILREYRDNLDALKDKYQILCANCNWIKRHELDE